MVEAAAGAEHAPGVLLGLDEANTPCTMARSRAARVVARPRPWPTQVSSRPDDLHLHGVDQPAAVAEVGVDEGARHAGGLGHLVERDEQRVVLGEQLLGGVGDQPPTGVGVEPGARAAGRGVVRPLRPGPGQGDGGERLARRQRVVAGHEVVASSIWRISGTSSVHCSSARGQRVRKRQPDGGDSGEGISPPSVWRSSGRTSGSGTGIALSRAAVYGCAGLGVEHVGVADLAEPAEVHDRHAVADVLHHREVVGDEHQREAVARPSCPRAG